MTFEDALISEKSFAILSGADLIDALDSTVTAHRVETLEVTGGKINLPAPISSSPNAETYVMLLDGNGEMSGAPVKIEGASGKVITNDLFKDGDIVLVDYYVDYINDALQIDITPDKFAGYYYVEAETLFRRELDGLDLPAQFILPKIKIQSNFTFTMASTGDPTTFSFTADAFPDYTKFDTNKKVLASLQILNANDNFDGGSAEDESGANEYQRFEYSADGGEYIWNKGVDGVNKGETIEEDNRPTPALGDRTDDYVTRPVGASTYDAAINALLAAYDPADITTNGKFDLTKWLALNPGDTAVPVFVKIALADDQTDETKIGYFTPDNTTHNHVLIEDGYGYFQDGLTVTDERAGKVVPI